MVNICVNIMELLSSFVLFKTEHPITLQPHNHMEGKLGKRLSVRLGQCVENLY